MPLDTAPRVSMSTDNTSLGCLEVVQELLLSRMTSIPEAAHGFNISCDTMVRSFGFGEVEGNEKTQVSYLVTSAKSRTARTSVSGLVKWQ